MLHFCEKLSLGKLTFSEKSSSSIELTSQVHAWHLIHKSLLIQNLSSWVENPLIRDFYFATNLLTFSGWNLVNVYVNVIFLHTAYNIHLSRYFRKCCDRISYECYWFILSYDTILEHWKIIHGIPLFPGYFRSNPKSQVPIPIPSNEYSEKNYPKVLLVSIDQ